MSVDTAYILAYSVIMLNTDQHNSQVKKRMTKQDFVKNNRGIDGGKDLLEEYLGRIFDEIANNEIVLNEEQAQKAGNLSTGDLGSFYSKDMAQVAIANDSMAMKTEAKFSNMKNKVLKRRDSDESAAIFYEAREYEHVKLMFQIVWSAALSCISAPLQETEDEEVIALVMDGFRSAIHIACLFGMETEKNAFVSTLAKLSLPATIQEVRSKSLECTRNLLEISFIEGSHFLECWKDIVGAISAMERLGLLGSEGEKEIVRIRRMSEMAKNQRKDMKRVSSADINAQSLSIAVDRIFTASSKLGGPSIVEFVKALCEISWEEIMSSSDRDEPRMYCLQRVVEVSHYNMNRIRVEWANMWTVLGEHFNQVGCHPNSQIAFFALDKLRQLALKFMDIEELANFKFQKDFLRPFEFILANNQDPRIKDMVLVCLQQLIQAKSKNLKSGWKAIFAAFSKAARELHGTLYSPVNSPFTNMIRIYFSAHVRYHEEYLQK